MQKVEIPLDIPANSIFLSFQKNTLSFSHKSHFLSSISLNHIVIILPFFPLFVNTSAKRHGAIYSTFSSIKFIPPIKKKKSQPNIRPAPHSCFTLYLNKVPLVHHHTPFINKVMHTFIHGFI